MMLHELRPAKGANKPAKRKGRGAASGNGKTAGYGHKGQKARSGAKKAGFEGGQMPLQRRLPKRGFNNIFAKHYAIIKLSDLENFEAGTTVTSTELVEKGIINNALDGVKVLGTGSLTKAVTVEAASFSDSAKKAIESAGGKAYTLININCIKKFDKDATVNAATLKEKGITKKEIDCIKIFGDGKASKAVTVQAAAFSDSAKEAIEKAGGKAEVK